MGIRDRDSVESQPEEALVNTNEKAAETVIAGEPAAVADTAVAAEAVPAVATTVAESSEVPPMPVFTPPVAAEALPAAVGAAPAQPETGPAPVGTLDARGPVEPATPSTQASLGLSALALGGLLAMWYEGRRKNDRGSEEDAA